MKPIIKKIKSKKELNLFLKNKDKNKIHDIYKKIQYELFINTQPKHYFGNNKNEAFNKYYKKILLEKDEYQLGNWIYFPWNKETYHLPNQNDYYKLRTIRNLYLVSPKDQNKLKSKKISIAGLSLGKGVLTSLVRYGIGNEFNIADSDILEVSNLNRADYSLLDYFKPKVTLTKQAILQIDPYLSIKDFPEGINENNIDDFISKADLLIDTFDHFPLKLLLRKKAAKYKIPVISGVDLEKGIILIVERYDIDKDLSQNIFLNNLDPSDLNKKDITKKDVTKFFIDLVGKKLHSEVMLQSVLAVGNDLTSYPQLIIASSLFSSVMTLAAEQILLNKNMPSGRTHIDLPSLLTKNTMGQTTT